MFQALATVATLLSFAPHGNGIDLKLDRGSAELVWVSGSSFRFRRSLEGPLPELKWTVRENVSYQIDDLPGTVRLRTGYLEVTIQKHGALLRINRIDGRPLVSDATEPRDAAGQITWERTTPSDTRFYGLGPRTDPVLDLRGKAADTAFPFLVSTAGYAEDHAGGGQYRFDFTVADRYRVTAPRIDYFFYYGPPPKEIYKEHNAANTSSSVWQAPAVSPPSWSGLRDTLLRMVHAAMSGVVTASFDLSAYDAAPADLQQRARQLGSLAARVKAGTGALSGFRDQLKTLYDAYIPEADYHGYPMWHPLPFQFPEDPECANHADEFLLGDEMLIAPIYDATGKRSIYLPQGIWTNLETNAVSPGRRTIAIETKALPVFARNGGIVPLDSRAGMALHYFPTLGAEFFILESDLGEYSQVHAAPAGDIMRLEIESKKDRDYQWVVHHIDRPSAVGFEDAKYSAVGSLAQLADRTWFYDPAQRNLHVRVHAKAGADAIVNLWF